MRTEITNQSETEKLAAAMAESQPVPQLQTVEQVVLQVLASHDGVCLDEPAERRTVAGALATALTDIFSEQAYLATVKSPKN